MKSFLDYISLTVTPYIIIHKHKFIFFSYDKVSCPIHLFIVYEYNIQKYLKKKYLCFIDVILLGIRIKKKKKYLDMHTYLMVTVLCCSKKKTHCEKNKNKQTYFVNKP